MAIPVALNDHCRAILKGRWNGQVETNNVFYFKVTEVADVTVPPATLNDLGNGLWQTIKTTLLATTADVQVYTEINCELLDEDANLVNGESFFIPTGEGVGAVNSESLPPADAFTLKIVRPNSAKRHGFKRFSGVPEGHQVDGRPTGGALSTLTSIAGTMGSVTAATLIDEEGLPGDIIGGAGMRAVILHRVFAGDFLDEVSYDYSVAVIFDKIGTQNTRKYGVGS